MLTCSSESTVQLCALCLSCSPSPPAPGEGDTIPANKLSLASSLLFAPSSLTPIRCFPQQDILQGVDCFRGGPDIADLPSRLCHIFSTVPYHSLRPHSAKQEMVQHGGCRVRGLRIPDPEKGSDQRAQHAPCGCLAGGGWLPGGISAATQDRKVLLCPSTGCESLSGLLPAQLHDTHQSYCLNLTVLLPNLAEID